LPFYGAIAYTYARQFSVVIPPPAIPLWAFISITNNETQQVTTITPKR
jgi:hypothetical protein